MATIHACMSNVQRCKYSLKHDYKYIIIYSLTIPSAVAYVYTHHNTSISLILTARGYATALTTSLKSICFWIAFL